jgi:hypothetical protein
MVTNQKVQQSRQVNGLTKGWGGGGKGFVINMQHPRTPLPGPDATRMAEPFSQPDILCAVTGRIALGSGCGSTACACTTQLSCLLLCVEGAKHAHKTPDRFLLPTRGQCNTSLGLLG